MLPPEMAMWQCWFPLPPPMPAPLTPPQALMSPPWISIFDSEYLIWACLPRSFEVSPSS